VECLIRKHDNRQFELKLSYTLQRRSRRDRFRFEMFVFLPYQLGIDSQSYSRSRFYADLHSYTRFKTPPLSLDEMLNRDLSTSPLNRIERFVEQGRAEGRWNEQRLVYELKMLSVLVRVAVRDAVQYAHSLLDGGFSAGARDDMSVALKAMLSNLAEVRGRMRRLGESLSGPGVPREASKTFRLVDEFVSLQTEALLLRLLRRLKKDDSAATGSVDLCELLRRAIGSEMEHRRTRGYVEAVAEDGAITNEYCLYREGLLKKFCAGVLFLSVARRSGRSRVRQTLFALAAALAMSVGVFGLWLADRYYKGNALAIGLVAVVLYVIRDRIKELIREIGSRLLPRWASDRKGKLVDPQTGKRVGTTRELLSWFEHDEVPADVLKARSYRDSLERMIFEPTEKVIHFDKEVFIESRRIFASHERSEAIDDIIRVNVGNWLSHMDNPRKRLLKLSEDSGDVLDIEARRVYHVNVVTRLHSWATGDTQIRRVRLILSRRGIERIESV